MTSATTPPKTSSHHFIDEMRPGEQITDDVFLISQKDLRTTVNGGLYIHVVLVDRTGQLLGRVWNATQQQYETIREGGFARLRGRTESYKGNLQFIIDAMRPAEADQIELADFMPHTKHDVEEMYKRVLAILRTVKNPHLLAFIAQFVKDETIVAGFKRAPAAVRNHHAYIGGLLEHTLSVLDLATRILGKTDDSESQYPEVSRDLVLVGVFLHDIGKAAELTYETSFTYSNAGQLVGHITQAAIWIDQKVADVEQESGERFPEDLQSVLTHIVVSHHGFYEYGSPKLPACPEAFVVHYLDNIDAKVHMSLGAIHDARNADSDWTEFTRSLDTRIFKKDVTGTRAGSSD
ncbi:MAG: HD domain-containing protein [Phycisphaerae bacterium]|nr:HD domain-containing protein [Phycisphaerae bacterium]